MNKMRLASKISSKIVSKKWVAFFGIWLLIGGLIEAELVRYQGVPRGSSVKIDGTSTVHDWTVEGKLIGGFMEVEGEFPADLEVEKVPDLNDIKVNVRIPVRSIKSGKSLMDGVMHKAMKQDKHPTIAYVLKKISPSSDERKSGSPLCYDSEGELTISGKTLPITMPVYFVGHGEGILRITGKTKVKMTDFGIKPPSPKIALGLIKTGDEVDITFEWIIKQREKK